MEDCLTPAFVGHQDLWSESHAEAMIARILSFPTSFIRIDSLLSFTLVHGISGDRAKLCFRGKFRAPPQEK